MLTTLKYKTKDQPIFFTSDTHFHHDRQWIFPKRGFSNVQEHDEMLIKRWNETVPPEALVFHLGDFIFESNSDHAATYFNRLNGKLMFIWGNHFSGTRQLYKKELLAQFGRDDLEIYPLLWNEKVVFLGDYVKLMIDNQGIVLSHFAYQIWDSMHHGSILLCGHSHGNFKEILPQATKGKRLDVGIDVFGRPISFQEVMKIMNNKDMVLFDHHNQETKNSF